MFADNKRAKMERIFSFILFLITLANCYVLLENVDCILPKILTPCENINLYFLGVAQEVTKDLREIGLPYFIQPTNNFREDSLRLSGVICDGENIHYGFMTPRGGYLTDITISNDLFSYSNTLYNVILHEILHSLGLDHNNGESGLMNYAVTENWFGSIINDQRKLWLSMDDILGITDNCFV